jgi:hypothetical protein
MVPVHVTTAPLEQPAKRCARVVSPIRAPTTVCVNRVDRACATPTPAWASITDLSVLTVRSTTRALRARFAAFQVEVLSVEQHVNVSKGLLGPTAARRARRTAVALFAAAMDNALRRKRASATQTITVPSAVSCARMTFANCP